MRSRFSSVITIATVLCAAATAAHGGKCTDVPLRFTVHETATLMNLDGTVVTDSSGNPVTVPSAIVGDGNDVYTNASIQFCSGTYDAVLNLINGSRKVSAILPAPIANSGTNSQTPPSGKYTVNGVLNVRNIVCNGCANPGQPFVARSGAELDSMYGGAEYNLRYFPAVNISTLPFAPDLDNDGARVGNANSPNASSLAIVLPQPYNCATGVYPSWIVRGTLQNSLSQPAYLQVGTLADLGKNGSGNTIVGQFSMPFEYQIQALSCFHPY
jgi:hypothetical protein